MDPVLPAERGSSREPGERRTGDPFTARWLAVFVLTAAMLAGLGYQTFQLVRERSTLQTIKVNQEATVVQAQRVRAQLDSIARRTLELAQQGNPGAASIVDQLARRGITINPTAAASAPPGSAPPGTPSR
jgi:N-acetylglucosamine kinase-like BadF-type ATPase